MNKFTIKEGFILKKKRYLNIKGAALDKEQLQMYMEKSIEISV